MPLFDDLRADWKAAPPSNHLSVVSPSRRTEFFNHYDGGAPLGLGDKPHSACLQRVREDQAFHMGSSRGWSDIGYNGLVCQHGRAIEGRGVDYVGAHCPDHNTTGYGMQFMVGGNEEPTPAAYARMRQLYDDCVSRSGRSLAKRGHRDGFATDCPGDLIYSWIKAGMTSPATAAQEDDMAQADVDAIKDYVKALLIDGYTVGGVKYPGLIPITVENQRRVTAVSEGLKALASTLPADAAKKVLDSLNAKYEADVVLKPKG